jgi:hypothetical protein
MDVSLAVETPKFLAIIGRVFTNQSTDWYLRKASRSRANRAVIHPSQRNSRIGTNGLFWYQLLPNPVAPMRINRDMRILDNRTGGCAQYNPHASPAHAHHMGRCRELDSR